MVDMNTSNVKGMLLNGVSKEDLIKALETEIATAQKEIDESKAQEAKNARLDEIRETLIHDIIDYMDALGVIHKDAFEEKDYRDIINSVKQLEKEQARKKKALLDSIRNPINIKATKSALDSDIDKLINEFIKTL